jgi:oligopeptide/dipeptide ABC transporter ATP-binding protein
MRPAAATTLLRVRDLSIAFATAAGTLPALHAVSFDVALGETLGLVGESGSGKSITALALLGLLDPAEATVTARAIELDGRSLLGLDGPTLRTVRGHRAAMIFQEPMTALNPALTIGWQIGEVLRMHRGLDRTAARAEAIRLLDMVRLPDARRRHDDYPHQFSGGQRQRILIAMAIACRPGLLIADEPTTALDVTIQAQILDLLRELVRDTGAGLLLITHDLGIVAQMCDRVAVMYGGRIVETAPVLELFDRPAHPYTRGLLAAATRSRAGQRLDRLPDIPGQVPALRDLPPGCAYAPRCPQAQSRCRLVVPPASVLAPAHSVACHYPQREDAG